MMISEKKSFSILNPKDTDKEAFQRISDITWHDLGMDQIVPLLTTDRAEQGMITTTMLQISADPEVAAYRQDVFDDLYRNPQLCNEMTKLLEQVHHLQEYMSLKREIDRKDGVWTLMNRLKEITDYIQCIESIQAALKKADIHSEGLLSLQKYVEEIYEDSAFTELKTDMANLRLTTSKVKSVTLGINLNENYEAESMGIVSLNNQRFTNSNIISNFTKKISAKDQVQEGTAWNQNYHFQQVDGQAVDTAGFVERTARTITATANPLVAIGLGLTRVNDNEPEKDVMEYMDKVVNHMLGASVRELKSTLAKYATVSIHSISGLMPEFVYYIRWADYIRKLKEQGYLFTKAEVLDEKTESPALEAKRAAEVPEAKMAAKDIYNLKLAMISQMPAAEIITNDLDFDAERNLYILTGANRGGKTTITQAIGQAFVLAQGGVFVQGSGFVFSPVDMIFTHFPADEDKTLDFGRLGEECSRFKEIYESSTDKSLILLNESFSTTSFEEGYYIACDAVKAILKKGARTIYNTHMHKLGRELDNFGRGVASLIVKSDGGKRSYKVELAPPEGQSYARDIAEKYGVTYEMLTGQN